MNKLKLVVEELAVDSFHTGKSGLEGRGTVHGNRATEYTPCNYTKYQTPCFTRQYINTLCYS